VFECVCVCARVCVVLKKNLDQYVECNTSIITVYGNFYINKINVKHFKH
jgi:hypothetical protein